MVPSSQPLKTINKLATSYYKVALPCSFNIVSTA